MFESKPMQYIGSGGIVLRTYYSTGDWKIGASIAEKGKFIGDSVQYSATFSWKSFTIGGQLCDSSYALVGVYKSQNFEQFLYYDNSSLLTGYTRINFEPFLNFPIQIKAEYCFDFSENENPENSRDLIRLKIFTPFKIDWCSGCVYLMLESGGVNFGIGANL